jgi:hypothetical protein
LGKTLANPLPAFVKENAEEVISIGIPDKS